jgi:4-hydroxybenzoate polyprenyltransferase
MNPASGSAAMRDSCAGAPVVCIDLDGTLVAGDALWESFIVLLTRDPLRALTALLSLRHGKAAFKERIARDVPVDAARLPYRPEVIERLVRLKQESRVLVLVTAADERHAAAVAEHVGLFDEVLASDGTINLSGRRKAALLQERYGRFDYWGNDWADIPVWRAASGATAVAAPPRLVRRVAGWRALDELAPRDSTLRWFVRALRPHQWLKNVLVFMPMFAAHELLDPVRWRAGGLTFLAFCLCASAIYIVNDILDIPSDRQHPRKRLRPFASGQLTIPFGVAAAGGLLLSGLGVAAFGVSAAVAGVAAVYVLFATVYSARLKRMPVVDVFALTGLYVIRLAAGAAATATVLSSWFLGFTLFFFLSLAYVKRYTELVATRHSLAGRGYGPADAPWVQAIGTCAGYMAVLILALYINAPEVRSLYSHPQILWGLCPLLLFWLTRLWFRASRGLVHDDPLVEALRDPVSHLVALAATIALFAAL